MREKIITEHVISTGCECVCSCMLLYIQLQAFLTCVGYVLCFAPVLMKMFRVAYIFRNPTHKKKVFAHRVVVIVTVVVVVVVV